MTCCDEGYIVFNLLPDFFNHLPMHVPVWPTWSWAVESGDCTKSALTEHAWSHQHPVDWDKVRVLEQQPRLYHRLTLESSHIRSHPHTLNGNNCILSPVPCFLGRYHFCTLHIAWSDHPNPLKSIHHLSPHLLSLTPTFSACFPCIVAYIKWVTLWMVVKTFGNCQSLLASEVR